MKKKELKNDWLTKNKSDAKIELFDNKRCLYWEKTDDCEIFLLKRSEFKIMY